MKKQNGKGFRIFFLVYALVLIALIVAALAVIRGKLVNYQTGRDAETAALAAKEEQAAYDLSVSRAPQLAFEDFVAGTDADYWTDLWFTTNPGSMDDAARVNEKMQELFSGEGFGLYKDESYSAESPVYLLKNGDTELATVAMTGSELDWTPGTVTLLLQGTEEASLEVPEGCTVYCNGTALDDSYAHDPVSYFDDDEYKDLLQNPVQCYTYTVTGQMFAPVLTGEAPADRTMITAEDGTCSYILSAADAEPYQQKGKEFIDALTYFYMMGASGTYGNAAKAQTFVQYNSQAYQYITNASEGVTWDTPYPGFTSTVTPGNVVIWADNCLTLDVDFQASGSASGYTNEEEGTYCVTFIDSGKGYEICGLKLK